MSLLAIIPCFNEGLTIQETIQSILGVEPGARIIVVDNASTDDTASQAEELGVKVLFEPRPGKGFAFRRGIALINSETTAVLMVDGDATYGMESLKVARKLVENDGCDMVIGVRTESSLKSRSEHYRRGHVLGNRMLSFVFRRFFGIQISDTLSGWRVFNPAFLYSFQGGNSGFELETELNAHVRSINALVTECPISYHGRVEGSQSKLSTYRDGWKILRKNLQLVKNERPFLAFTILASPWLAVSLILMSLVLSDYFSTGLVPRFPSLIAAVGAFAVAAQLGVAGIILERVRLNRITQLQAIFRSWQYLRK
jgi:glycosyltransferase involved in cell wall biosynthesis